MENDKTVEQIALKLIECLNGQCHCRVHGSDEQLIAKALESYAEESIIEDRKIWDAQYDLDLKLHSEQARKEGYAAAIKDIEIIDSAESKGLSVTRTAYKRGFKDAIEQAAQIAEDFDSPGTTDLLFKRGAAIAKQIRSLAKETPRTTEGLAKEPKQ